MISFFIQAQPVSSQGIVCREVEVTVNLSYGQPRPLALTKAQCEVDGSSVPTLNGCSTPCTSNSSGTPVCQCPSGCAKSGLVVGGQTCGGAQAVDLYTPKKFHGDSCAQGSECGSGICQNRLCVGNGNIPNGTICYNRVTCESVTVSAGSSCPSSYPTTTLPTGCTEATLWRTTCYSATCATTTVPQGTTCPSAFPLSNKPISCRDLGGVDDTRPIVGGCSRVGDIQCVSGKQHVCDGANWRVTTTSCSPVGTCGGSVCGANEFCQNNRCWEKQSIGDLCGGDNNRCLSGQCVDGKCTAEACSEYGHEKCVAGSRVRCTEGSYVKVGVCGDDNFDGICYWNNTCQTFNVTDTTYCPTGSSPLSSSSERCQGGGSEGYRCYHLTDCSQVRSYVARTDGSRTCPSGYSLSRPAACGGRPTACTPGSCVNGKLCEYDPTTGAGYISSTSCEATPVEPAPTCPSGSNAIISGSNEGKCLCSNGAVVSKGGTCPLTATPIDVSTPDDGHIADLGILPSEGRACYGGTVHGQKACSDLLTIMTCNDGLYERATRCPAGQLCSNGRCAPTLTPATPQTPTTPTTPTETTQPTQVTPTTPTQPSTAASLGRACYGGVADGATACSTMVTQVTCSDGLFVSPTRCPEGSTCSNGRCSGVSQAEVEEPRLPVTPTTDQQLAQAALLSEGRACSGDVPHGEYACSTSRNLVQCVDGAFTNSATCPEGVLCRNGRCGDGSIPQSNQSVRNVTGTVCTANQAACLNTTFLRICNADGTQVRETRCPTGTSCLNGSCNPVRSQEKFERAERLVPESNIGPNGLPIPQANDRGFEPVYLEGARLERVFPPDYVPELTTVQNTLVHPEAVDNLEAFFDAAAEQGITLVIRHGYRSYGEQAHIYNARNCPELTARGEYCGAATPGASQHQGGRAVDLWVNDNGTVKPVTQDIVELAAEFGIEHPLGEDDMPHFFVPN
jgi:hypothetical protein